MLDSPLPCSQTTPPTRDLPDHARAVDHRKVGIDQVGIRGLRVPVQVGEDATSLRPTVADVSMSVSLPPDVRGTHMSRLVEIVQARRDFVTPTSVLAILSEMCDRLGAADARLELGFPWFVDKQAPVSRATSSMEYRCAMIAEQRGGQRRLVRRLEVPVTSLCPCSKAVSDRGAHNQRSLVRVDVVGAGSCSFDRMIQDVEGCASAPLYTLLKRQDEKLVTEQAYDNPRFVEDLVRDVLLALQRLPEVESVRVSVDNFESIHNHSAFAELSWRADEEPEEASAPQPHPEALPFGHWLRHSRTERGLSQVALARALGLSPSFLSKVERGASNLSEESLEAVAAALGEPTLLVKLRAGLLPKRVLDAVRARPEEFLDWVGC
jgi:GTP cyclohydrolase IB